MVRSSNKSICHPTVDALPIGRISPSRLHLPPQSVYSPSEARQPPLARKQLLHGALFDLSVFWR